MAKSLWLLIALSFASLGCSSTIAKPTLGHPGSFAYQRWRSEVFDPYPMTDVGPEVVGGRPPGATKPAPEPQRTGNSLLQRFGPEPSKLTPGQY